MYPSSDGHLAVSTSYPLELCCNKLRVQASLVNTDPISSGCLCRSEIAGSDHTAVLFLMFQGTFLVCHSQYLITSFSRAVFLHFLARTCFLPLPSREREGSHFLVFLFILSCCTQLPSIFFLSWSFLLEQNDVLVVEFALSCRLVMLGLLKTPDAHSYKTFWDANCSWVVWGMQKPFDLFESMCQFLICLLYFGVLPKIYKCSQPFLVGFFLYLFHTYDFHSFYGFCNRWKRGFFLVFFSCLYIFNFPLHHSFSF